MNQNNISLESIIEALEMSYKYSNVDGEDTLVPQQVVLDAITLLKADLQAQQEAQAALETVAHMEQWEPIYNPNDGSLWGVTDD